jgi:hypothetical protein
MRARGWQVFSRYENQGLRWRIFFPLSLHIHTLGNFRGGPAMHPRLEG